MKKTVFTFLIVVVSFIITPFAFADLDRPQDPDKKIVFFPNALKIVEDEAFEGTAARIVIFPEGLHSIGNFAFADSRNLVNVHIPSSVEKIGQNAFSSSKKLTFHGLIGSLAEKWAKEHQIPFMASNIWNVINNNRDIDKTNRIPSDGLHQAVYSGETNNLHERSLDEGKSMRPQERPELNPIDYRFP